MAFDRAAAKAAGYSDEEIEAYLQANPEVAKDTPPPPSGSEDRPPAPSTVIPDIDRTNEVLATGGAALAGAGEILPYAGAAYGAYKGSQYLNAGLEAIKGYGQRTAVNEFNTLMNNYSKMNHDIRQYQKAGQPVPQSLLDSQAKLGQQIEAAQSRISTTPAAEPAPAPKGPVKPAGVPAQAAGAVAPEVTAGAEAAQAARAAAPAAEAAGGIMSKVAPYLQAAGKVAAPVARVAGPVGMVASAYEAAPYLKEANVGPRTASGEVGRMVKGANRMALNMPTPAPLSAQEAKNLLDSGDERTINIYGGRQRLQQIANPNALNSGYAQQLNRLGR